MLDLGIYEIEDLDENVRDLVISLSDYPGVKTISSCGGHENPSNIQKPLGEWFVGLYISRTPAGRDTLEFLLWAINDVYQKRPHKGMVALEISAPYYGNRRAWFVRGKDSDPIELALWLLQIKSIYPDGKHGYQQDYSDLWFLKPTALEFNPNIITPSA